jgi:ubiquinone/menaquinone biosynthesis C-methylase UbiE
MQHHEVGRYWNENAEAWTQLSRAGYDVYRDLLNTPSFLSMLPNVQDLSGIDIGCGEGTNTRKVSQRGAKLVAIDISDVFIRHALDTEQQSPMGIDYRVASAVDLPFPDNHFDFATAFMSFMDIPETSLVLSETHRVLQPGGFLQFSISHPCFDTPHRRNLRDIGRTYAIEVGDYFRNLNGEISEWLFGAAPTQMKKRMRKFRIPRFNRPISEWFNLVLRAGFMIERVEEPTPTDEIVQACPDMQDTQVVAYFLHIRARKPAH